MASEKPPSSRSPRSSSLSGTIRAIEHVLVGLGRVQARRPSLPIGICFAIAVVAALFAARLQLKTRFDQLLPENQPSVVELRRVLDRAVSASKAFVVLESNDHATLRACGDAMVPTLVAVGAPSVTNAEDGVQVARSFLLRRAGFFTTTEELKKLDHDFEARWDYEVSHATGSALDDDEAPPPFSAAEVKKRFQKGGGEERFPDGYYESKDGKALVVVVSTAIAGGDLTGSQTAYDAIRKASSDTLSSNVCKGVRAGYAGDLVTGLTEYGAVKDDLLSVGALGIGMVLAIILVFFMRIRALVTMGCTIAIGLAWTFGLTEIVIGHLNVATGFLVSIVAGNGINFAIIYISRYFEELRRGHNVEMAVAIAHKTTWPSTLTAAAAAAASYGSLWITDFRAFKHFAFIGAAGMIVCWAATYIALPALLVVYERWRPFKTDESTAFGRLRMRGVRYDAPLALIVPRAPKLFTIMGMALAVVGVVLAVAYVRNDPMEYDMRKVRGNPVADPDNTRIRELAADVLGGALDGSMVVVADRVDQVEPLTEALEARRDAAPEGQKPFEAVDSLFKFVPKDQAAKLPILLSIRERLLRARDKGMISDEEWPEIERSLPPENVTTFGINDLPDDLARSFTEKNGTRGTLLLIEPTVGELDSDLHYLLRWAASFRETRLPSGELIRGSGRAVIFADVLNSIVGDMPAAIILSFVMTMAAVLVTFRRGWSALIVMGALLVGCAWLAAFMFAFHVKLNMFNFVALPITFGIGVDYAVNLVQRYEAERSKGIMSALRTTGGAVVLCSMTTVLGYLALIGSVNPAIRSMGILAVLGEVCCLVAALIVLPAFLLWRASLRTPAEVAAADNAREAAGDAADASAASSPTGE